MCAQRSFYTFSAHVLFFFNDTATTEIYTLSLHDALPISFGFLAVRTSAKEPLSLAPRSVTLSLPAAMPSLTRRSACARSWYQWPFRSSSGVYGPQSQTITSPAPYCLGGITPSKEA